MRIDLVPRWKMLTLNGEEEDDMLADRLAHIFRDDREQESRGLSPTAVPTPVDF